MRKELRAGLCTAIAVLAIIFGIWGLFYIMIHHTKVLLIALLGLIGFVIVGAISHSIYSSFMRKFKR